MDSIVDFLAEDRIPDDKKEASKVHRVASRIGYQRIRSYIGGPSEGYTFYAYIQGR